MICLFGGTFDPVHNGHLHAARTAAGLLACRVRLVLAARPPHRRAPAASPEHRWAMLQAACAGRTELIPDDAEIRRPDASYTVHTLGRVRRQHPDRPVFWVVGMDAFRELRSWHRWREIFDLAHLLLLNRPGVVLDGPARQLYETFRLEGIPSSAAGGILRIEAPMPDVSASRIRLRVAENRPVSHLLPDGVEAYIRQQKLYSGDGASTRPGHAPAPEVDSDREQT